MDWTWIPPTIAATGWFWILFKAQRNYRSDNKETLDRIEKKVDKMNGVARSHGEAIAAISAACKTRHEGDKYILRRPE